MNVGSEMKEKINSSEILSDGGNDIINKQTNLINQTNASYKENTRKVNMAQHTFAEFNQEEVSQNPNLNINQENCFMLSDNEPINKISSHVSN